jgi:hypothetical protein
MALVDLPYADGNRHRNRVREPGFLLIGRDDPDVVGELPRNLLEQLDPVRLDAVVVDNEDAMIAELRRRFDIQHSPPPTYGAAPDLIAGRIATIIIQSCQTMSASGRSAGGNR